MIAAVIAVSAFGLALVAAATALVWKLLGVKDDLALAETVRDAKMRNAVNLQAQLDAAKGDNARLKGLVDDLETKLAAATAAAIARLPTTDVIDRVNGVHADSGAGGQGAGDRGGGTVATDAVPGPVATAPAVGPARRLRGAKR